MVYRTKESTLMVIVCGVEGLYKLPLIDTQGYPRLTIRKTRVSLALIAQGHTATFKIDLWQDWSSHDRPDDKSKGR